MNSKLNMEAARHIRRGFAIATAEPGAGTGDNRRAIIAKIAVRYGVSVQTVRNVLNNKVWKEMAVEQTPGERAWNAWRRDTHDSRKWSDLPSFIQRAWAEAVRLSREAAHV